jgi:hypothetical protein
MAQQQTVTPKTILTILTIIVILSTAAASAIMMYQKVKAIEPEVQANTEARRAVEKDIEWIKGSLRRIEDRMP